MVWRLSVATRNAVGNALVDQLDIGGTATIQFRTALQPASADNAATGTLLATVTCGVTAWGDFAAGVGPAEAVTSDLSIDTTGTVGYARFLNGDGTTHSDMDVAENAGTFSFDDVDWTAGGKATVTAMSITMPAE